MRLIIALCAVVLAGCAPLALEHQADAAFRRALVAQLADQPDYAEQQYQEVIRLGYATSPVWNNLAVIAVHRHQYIVARRLLARAVETNQRDVVALTNYGVMSYYLSDFAVARRSLVDAQQLRRDLLTNIPTVGPVDWERDHYERVTEPLVQLAQKYLDRIDRAQLGAEVPAVGDAVAALRLRIY